MAYMSADGSLASAVHPAKL